ncbi:uncharacterized protein LOC107307584 isoform X1 [Coturnix japonica]|uniref:uncharacterized protein LOC107307584 isoform X1 n=1 Tax=Coturnix japonica TaxID=93934 RepID=UPI000776FE33|nr:uncharacterized protein LOC107307584 isoform X1 [Coturnix japonica]
MCSKETCAAPWRAPAADDDVGVPYPDVLVDTDFVPQGKPRGPLGGLPEWRPVPEPGVDARGVGSIGWDPSSLLSSRTEAPAAPKGPERQKEALEEEDTHRGCPICQRKSQRRRQHMGLTQSLLTGMHFSKASVAHCPSLWEKERPRKQLALQVRAAGRAPWPWLEVAPLPLHPVPRDLGTLSFWEQGHQNHIQQRWEGIGPFSVPPSHSPCIPSLLCLP